MNEQWLITLPRKHTLAQNKQQQQQQNQRNETKNQKQKQNKDKAKNLSRHTAMQNAIYIVLG